MFDRRPRRIPFGHGALAAILGTGLLAIGPAAAQSGSALEQELLWLRAESITVITASLVEESVSHAPGTAIVVTRRQIQERGYRSLLDLLRDLPGFDAQTLSQAESVDRMGFRGVVGNEKFLILQDGFRISSPTAEPISQIRENFPLYAARQVEIVYGPGSALYGADAFTGVVNIITDDTANSEWEVNVEGGQYAARRVEIHGTRALGDEVTLAIGGHYQDADNADLSEAFPDIFALTDLKDFGGNVIVAAGDRAGYNFPTESYSSFGRLDIQEEFTLGWFYSVYQAPTTVAGRPELIDYGVDAFNESHLGTVYARYRFDLDGDLSGTVDASYSRYEQDPASKFSNLFTAFGDGFKYGKGERVQIAPQLTYARGDHILIGGLTLEGFNATPHTTDLPKPFQTDRPSADQGLFYPGTDGTLPIKIFEVDYSNFGAFLQEKTAWTAEFSTTLGIRFDENSDYGSSVNPRVGFTFEPRSTTTLKGLYGEAFLAPSPFQRFEHFGSFSGTQNANGEYQAGFFRLPNPDLKPEKIRTAELGVTQRVGDAFSVNVVGYYSQLDGLIQVGATQVGADAESDFVPGGVIAATNSEDNVGDLESKGIDVSLAWNRTWTRARLDAWANYSWVDGDLTNTQSGLVSTLPYVSDQKVKLGGTLNYADRYILSPSAHWIGEANLYVPDPTSSNFGGRAPDYVRVDLYAEVRNLGDRFSVFARASNLLNHEYFTATRAAGLNLRNSPQPGREIQAGVRISL